MSKKQKELTFEERMQRLQRIVATLEGGEKPLEESVALYKEGLEHSVACRDLLAKARHEIEVLTEGALAPFDTARCDEESEGGE